MLDLRQEDTHAEPRKYLREAIWELKIPLCGGPRGYYVIENKKELATCIQDLNNRIKGIQERKTKVIEAFNDYYKE